MVFSVYAPARADWDRIRTQRAESVAQGLHPLILSVPGEDIPQDLEVFYADYKPLITLNRANGGATYLDNGEVISKWSPKDVPSGSGLSGLLQRDPVDAFTDFTVKRRIRAQGFTLYLLALLLLL